MSVSSSQATSSDDTSDSSSDASSDLYAEVDSPAQAPQHPSSVHDEDDEMYDDDSSVSSPVQSKGKRRLGSEEAQPKPVKRRKLVLTPEQYFSPSVPATAGLPAEVWQHIFLYFAPDDLSRCLRVSRTFRSYITSLTASMGVRLPPRRNGLKLLDSDTIWSSSRKVFAPNLPRPLAGFDEMHMFQLLGGKGCQVCGMDGLPLHPTNPFNAGPGPNGVRVIWSFALRLCAACFEAASVKDVDLLVSPVAPLRGAIPYAFCTPDLHYIPATIQPQAATAIKGTMFKVYSLKHMDDLQQEHQTALEFGEAAAEEWVKGLALLGKQQMADAARWERWEALYPPGSDIAKVLREYFRPSSAPSVDEVPVAVAPPPVSATSLPAPPSAKMKHPLPARVVAAPSTSHSVSNAQSPQQPSKNQVRPPRNLREVNEAKAIRRAEIERRCYEEFQPPLMPAVLQHMESFNAAMQIITPLTDSAWEVLKPRLYAQRDAAEQIEYMREEQLRALQATIPDPSYASMYNYQPDNSAATRQYESAQAPIRKKLGSYAEEFIRAKWKNGKIKREDCPVFAVEVLLYARNKYVEVHKPKDVSSDYITQTTDPWFVALENMRWLYDNKVKPCTDKLNRELFHCVECESAGKAYAFEGMIQHYGAKHTTDFSQGNIVVHWQSAEWPEDPPFIPSNGQTADPTLPGELAPKKSSKLTGKSGKPSGVAPVAMNIDTPPQPAYWPPAYQNGAAWPHPGYPPAPYPHGGHQVYAPYSYPYAQYPTDPYYQQAAYPPTVVRDSTVAPTAAPTTDPTAAAQAQTTPSGQLYQDQLNEIATVARETFDSTSGVKGLEESVRIQTVLHHVVSRFKARFGNEPSLDLITDSLANHILMRPIKNATGIACKTCVSSRLDGYLACQPYATRIADSKLYNTSSLITHFKTVHLQSADDATLNWKEDMIELPEDATIRELMNAVGMNDDKLATIAQAYPEIFPKRLPRIGEVKESAKPATKQQESSAPSRRTSQKKNKKLKRTSSHRAEETQDEQSDVLPEAAEDEYDPRRPAFIEPADRGHTNSGRRSIGEGQRKPPPSVDLTTLAPETLEALSRLYPTNPEVQQALAKKAERSPSVPRAGAASPNDPYHQNRNAHQANSFTSQQSVPVRETSGHATRNGRGPRAEPKAEDYTQIIRTPASGPYDQQTITAPPAPQERYVRVDSRGYPVEQPSHEPAPYGYDPRGGHPGYYPRPEYRMEHPPPPVSYGYEPPPETVYVDQYGRPVEVVRVIERHPPPMYGYPPHPQEYYREDPQRRYVYYGQASPPGPPIPPAGYPGAPRYVYEDDRGSVPRM